MKNKKLLNKTSIKDEFDIKEEISFHDLYWSEEEKESNYVYFDLMEYDMDYYLNSEYFYNENMSENQVYKIMNIANKAKKDAYDLLPNLMEDVVIAWCSVKERKSVFAFSLSFLGYNAIVINGQYEYIDSVNNSFIYKSVIHEIGHHLDAQYALTEDLENMGKLKSDEKLMKLLRSPDTTYHLSEAYDEKDRYVEQFADLFTLYFTGGVQSNNFSKIDEKTFEYLDSIFNELDDETNKNQRVNNFLGVNYDEDNLENNRIFDKNEMFENKYTSRRLQKAKEYILHNIHRLKKEVLDIYCENDVSDMVYFAINFENNMPRVVIGCQNKYFLDLVENKLKENTSSVFMIQFIVFDTKKPDDIIDILTFEDKLNCKNKSISASITKRLIKKIANNDDVILEEMFLKIKDLSISNFDIQNEIDSLVEKSNVGEINLGNMSISEVFKKLLEERKILDLDEQFIEKHKDYFDWKQISQFCELNDSFIEKYEEYVDWSLIPIYQHNITQSFYNTHKEKFITKTDSLNTYIESPLNYTGTKHKLLPVIIDNFPPKINKFVDLFAGGFNVGLNVEANEIVCNDIDKNLINLYEKFKDYKPDDLIQEIKNIIEEYRLEDVEEGMNSIEKYNRAIEGFLKLRDNYNQTKDPVKLFVLICYSHNNNMRFNQDGKYNQSIGYTKPKHEKSLVSRKRYNKSTEEKLFKFVDELSSKNVKFTSGGFYNLDISKLGSDDLVYCDPPYLASGVLYSSGWTESDERKLLKFLSLLNKKKIKFALSNVLKMNGQVNKDLVDWCKDYNVKFLDKEYDQYQKRLVKKDDNYATVEVLITNY